MRKIEKTLVFFTRGASKSKFLSVTRLFLGVLWCLCLAGCAVIQGKDLPTISYEQIKPYAVRPSVSYDAKFLASGTFGPKELGNTESHGFRSNLLAKRIERVMARANFFSEFPRGATPLEYHVSLTFSRTEEISPLKVVHIIISGLTFCLFPAWFREDYCLTARVMKGMEVLREYEYRDHKYGVMWTLIGMLGYSFYILSEEPGLPPNYLIEKMLLNFLNDLQEDPLLQPTAREIGNCS